MKKFPVRSLVDGLLKENRFPGKGLPTVEFYVVTKTRPGASLNDILFKTNIEGIIYQMAGGLKIGEIAGLYGEANAKEAKAHAERILSGEEK